MFSQKERTTAASPTPAKEDREQHQSRSLCSSELLGITESSVAEPEKNKVIYPCGTQHRYTVLSRELLIHPFNRIIES